MTTSPSSDWETLVTLYRACWAEAESIEGGGRSEVIASVAATLFIEANRRGLRKSIADSNAILDDPYRHPATPAGPHAVKFRITDKDGLPA